MLFVRALVFLGQVVANSIGILAMTVVVCAVIPFIGLPFLMAIIMVFGAGARTMPQFVTHMAIVLGLWATVTTAVRRSDKKHWFVFCG